MYNFEIALLFLKREEPTTNILSTIEINLPIHSQLVIDVLNDKNRNAFATFFEYIEQNEPELLEKSDAKLTLLDFAIYANNGEIVNKLLQNNAKPIIQRFNIKDFNIAASFFKHGATLLYILPSIELFNSLDSSQQKHIDGFLYFLKTLESSVLHANAHHFFALAMKSGAFEYVKVLFQLNVPLTENILTVIENVESPYRSTFTNNKSIFEKDAWKRFQEITKYQNGVFLKEHNVAFFKLCFELKLFDNIFAEGLFNPFDDALQLANINTEFLDAIGHKMLRYAILKTSSSHYLTPPFYLVALLKAGIVPDAQFVELDESKNVLKQDPNDYSQRLSFAKKFIEYMRIGFLYTGKTIGTRIQEFNSFKSTFSRNHFL